MKFKSKRDSTYLSLMSVAIGVIVISCLFPLVFAEVWEEPMVIMILLSICLVTVGFALWVSLDIYYIFEDKALFLKAGPFRKRIAYDEITSISPTKDILTGYRLLSSKDAIAIYYKTGVMGEVKISPVEKEKFIEELKKRVPQLVLKGF